MTKGLTKEEMAKLLASIPTDKPITQVKTGKTGLKSPVTGRKLSSNDWYHLTSKSKANAFVGF